MQHIIVVLVLCGIALIPILKYISVSVIVEVVVETLYKGMFLTSEFIQVDTVCIMEIFQQVRVSLNISYLGINLVLQFIILRKLLGIFNVLIIIGIKIGIDMRCPSYK